MDVRLIVSGSGFGRVEGALLCLGIVENLWGLFKNVWGLFKNVGDCLKNVRSTGVSSCPFLFLAPESKLVCG